MLGSIEEMHYYFNEQLKAADNSTYQQFLVPQIDFLFNVAQDVYVKMIAFPLYNPIPKFELTSRVRNNIYTLVVNAAVKDTNVTKYDDTSYLYKLPTDCQYFLGGSVVANNGDCYKELELFSVTHEHSTTKDYTIKSSFLWEECNYLMIEGGIKLEVIDFNVEGVKPNYVRYSKYMHYAEKHSTNGYKKITGETLTGKQNSELPKNALVDVVNIAVLLTKMDLGMDVNTQLSKIRDIN